MSRDVASSSNNRRAAVGRLRRRGGLVGVIALAVVAASLTPSVSAAGSEDLPGTRPASAQAEAAPNARALAAPSDGPGGLHVVVNERGRITRSGAAVTSDGETTAVRIDKPEGAQVRSAFLATATTGFTGSPLSTPVQLEGKPVPLTGEIPTGISSYNYFADVTEIVKSTIDAAPAGPVFLDYREPQAWLTDGSILEVIFDDPAVAHDQSVTILYGALKPTGDTYDVTLSEPLDLSDPATRLEMALGVSFSYQSGGAQQYSTVDVNGRRLTTAAGGEDDGRPHNGGLITLGGVGDAAGNPADPNARPTQPRSDDELYDLTPMVGDGDTRISVTTNNPSLDDNILLATFTMNPPVTSISTGDPGFVYVAFGDSYQSGEGAAIDLRPAATYLSEGFENGSNYPAAVGGQENTYTSNAQGPNVAGNACHRALGNYAKTNRDLFAPGQDVLLIDRTCSGATIEPSDGGKPPIVGPAGSAVDPTSQLQQALDLLAAQGLSGDDVDLVTVGMGGNDARFGDIVMACVGPALLEAALRKYPNTPGEISWVSQQATCKRVDEWFLKTGDAVKALGGKEKAAQAKLLDAFGNARVLQLDYPNILPTGDAPSWCGGLRGGDIDYANQKLADINEQVTSAISQTGKIELVDVGSTFGSNALCPSSAGELLAVGISEDNFDTEVTRLLNLDGDGDADARTKLDELVEAYQALKACIAKNLNPFGGGCDVVAAKDVVLAKGQAVLEYMQANERTIFGNMMSPPGSSDDTEAVAFDRSRNLFHPNAAGHKVQACAVLSVFNHNSSLSDCSGSTDQPSANSPEPISVRIREALRIIMEHFRPFSPVRIRLYSTPVDLGEATADAQGTVSTDVVIPDVPAGVHRLEVQGEGQNGTQVTQQLLVRVAGRPTGSYTTYLTGFTPRPEQPTPGADIEEVAVTVNGLPLGTFQVDSHGGVLISLPSVEQLTSSAPIVITATSLTTGKQVSESVVSIPSTPSLWATSTGAEALTISGSRLTANGRVHSEGGLRVRGSGHILTGGVEHAAALDIAGAPAKIDPAPARVPAGEGHPRVATIADFRPGAAIASASSQYTAVPAAACVDGVWRPDPGAQLEGVVYVPCGVHLNRAGRYGATIAAEGPITVSGRSITIGRTDEAGAGSPALVSGASGTAIALHGADLVLLGPALAEAGGVAIDGARATLNCGVVAAQIKVAAADTSVPMTSRCLPSDRP